MAELQEQISQCQDAHERLHRAVQLLDDRAMVEPSRLPGWTLAHVVSHLAQNADSVTRRLAGALSGEVVEQYPGGKQERDRDIVSGSRRDAATIIADLLRADQTLDDMLAKVTTADGWNQTVLASSGRRVPARHLVFARWREVETHHVDLDLGYEYSFWPDELVQLWLPRLIEDLANRADAKRLTAWLVGRAAAPELPPWG